VVLPNRVYRLHEPPFRVLTTPAFEREFRAISRKDSPLVRALEELMEILSNHPHHRSGRHKIKKLAGLKPGERQWRVRCAGETIACVTRFLGAKSCCIPSAPERGRWTRTWPLKHRSVYFPANSFFTASLTTLPSTRIPAAAKRAIAAFITVPMSFMAGAGVISALEARTPAAISSSPAAFGK
jgi:hypothetical protein